MEVPMAARRKGAARGQFKLMSPDFRPNGPIAMEQVFNGFGCSGQNISPALGWSGAPADTKTFALLVHDPDAPTGGAGSCTDRKSTRLNSSHANISYAVFCLKKK